MVRNCIIVHGCPDHEEEGDEMTYDKNWIPWTKKKLEEKGYNVFVPLMPHPWKPVYEEHKKVFDKLDISEDTVDD